MKKASKIICAAIAVCMLLAIASLAATEALKTIQVSENIKITIDGAEFKPKDGNGNEVKPFVYNGVAYVPMSAFANALGYDSMYDLKAQSIIITKKSNITKEYTEVFKLDFTTMADGTAPFRGTNISNICIKNGLLKGKGTNSDPNLIYIGSDFNFPADSIQEIHIRLKNHSTSYDTQFFFTTKTIGWSEDASFKNYLDWNGDDGENNNWNKIIYSTDECPEWTGTVTNFRIDPSAAAGDFEIESIIFYSISQSTSTTNGKTTKPPETTKPVRTPTTGESNALKRAKDYLKTMAFSRSGLIKQLEYEKYTNKEAVYAVDNCGADWKAQAVKKAKNYLDFMAFSRSGLIKQLEYEGFTNEQAVHGTDKSGADWKEQAVKKAKSYLDIMSFSRDGLIKQLEYEGFTHEQAVYGAEKNGY